MDFEVEYYPEEIAVILMNLAGDSLDTESKDCSESDYIECISTLRAICQNKYNSEFYRRFYRLLERVAAKHEYD